MDDTKEGKTKPEIWRSNARWNGIPRGIWQAQLKDAANIVEDLQATADRRLELLRRCNEYMAMCPFCRSKSTDFHAEDCRLAKELSDE